MGRYGTALVRAGKTEEGLAALREATSIGAANGEVFYQAELHRLTAEALAQTGASSEVIGAELAAATRIATEQGATAFANRARAVSAAALGT